MRIDYCDLCGCPLDIKSKKYVMIVAEDITERLNHCTTYQEVTKVVNTFNLEKKEICSNCKKIHDTLFAEKLKAIDKLTKDIKALYKLRK